MVMNRFTSRLTSSHRMVLEENRILTLTFTFTFTITKPTPCTIAGRSLKDRKKA